MKFYFDLQIPSTLGDKLGDRLGEDVINSLSKNEIKILKIITEDNQSSMKTMSKKTGLSDTGVEKIINRLKMRMIIERIGSTRKGYWKIIEE